MIKNWITGILSLGIFLISSRASAQEIDSTQLQIAQTFLYYVTIGLTDSSWQLFDKLENPNVTKEEFVVVMNQLKGQLTLFDSIEMIMNGVSMIGDREFNLYSFKPISGRRNIVDDVSIDITFAKASRLVAGIRPKKLIKENAASTSSGKETQIEGPMSIMIDSNTYHVTGINIVHFTNDEGLLAIQVEYALPDDVEKNDPRLKTLSIKLAKYLMANGYMEKAKIKAKEIDKKLLDNIGVSFLDPSHGGGVNIMVTPDEYH